MISSKEHIGLLETECSGKGDADEGKSDVRSGKESFTGI